MYKFSTVALSGIILAFAGCQDQTTPTDPNDVLAPQLSSNDSEAEDRDDHEDGEDGEDREDGDGGDPFDFDDLVGVPRPFGQLANAIREVKGAGLPWVLDEGEAELDEDGTLEIEVEGLVFDPNDQAVIDRGRAGINTSETFGGVLSCLTSDAGGTVATVVNVATGRFPATTGLGAGDSEIEETLTGIPDPCIAPIVFVTSGGGNWFAASGFPSSGGEGGDPFEFDDMVGVPRPFAGRDTRDANAIRTVIGAGRAWVVDRAEASLDEDGTLEIEVEGLVIDPNEDSGNAGRNPAANFRGLLSCLTPDAGGEAVILMNIATGPFPATEAGDSEIEETLIGIPDPCIAPIVFVTSEGGSWFAASGF